MCEGRIAGAKDAVGTEFLLQLLSQCRLDVDLGQNAESLRLKKVPDTSLGPFHRPRHLDREFIAASQFNRLLSVVVELHCPAPLLMTFGRPPGGEDTDLAAGQDHQLADVTIARPVVLARHLAAV